MGGEGEAAVFETLSWKGARRLVVLVVGCTVMLLGLVMLVTPGPGVAVIVGGLALLATEFVWARRLLRAVKSRIGSVAQTLNSKKD